MRKQYRTIEAGAVRYEIELYHDGALVETRKVWLTEIEEETDKLEADGYTYGYTAEEVERAKRMYEHKLNGLIR